ncbi:MAG TPA: dienelactone hydrolase family protein [Gemmatimonadaceae bacterium]|nr:dienelactone hydrolase family protein [Gemmatimonadaceae bacterium]
MKLRHLLLGAIAVAGAACQRTATVGSPAPSAIMIVQPDTTLPPSNATAAARLAASTRRGEWVKIPWGGGATDSLMAWVVYPNDLGGRARAPVVVVVHEIFGLSTWVRGVADEFAARGFIAIAPDLASRVRGGPSTVELASAEASALFRNPGIPMADRNQGIVAVAQYAMSRPNAVQKYGVVGFCWGGQTTWGHAIHGGAAGFAGGISYYGAFPYGTPGTTPAGGRVNVPRADSLAKVRVPMMVLNGSRDAGIAAQLPHLDSMMKAQNKPFTSRNYDNADHGFLRAQADPKATRDTANERANVAASKDAWPLTIQFFNQYLKR